MNSLRRTREIFISNSKLFNVVCDGSWLSVEKIKLKLEVSIFINKTVDMRPDVVDNFFSWMTFSCRRLFVIDDSFDTEPQTEKILLIIRSHRCVFFFEKWKRIHHFLLSTIVFSRLFLDNFDFKIDRENWLQNFAPTTTFYLLCQQHKTHSSKYTY